MTPEEIKQFNRFLKEKGAYKQFYNKFNQGFAFGLTTVYEYLGSVSAQNILVYAFLWDANGYWGNINEEWKVFLKAKNEQNVKEC